jgi:anionic cell wall polymer biosynthesis LytR-Cps2A-Psr (LCP) family protein
MVRQVNSLLGISIHQYVVMDMKAFAHFIDALGGIDVYVETNMDYQDPEAGLTIHLEQGYRHLDGAKSLEYLRYRGEELGDVGRVQRQQKFVKAVYSKILQFETLPKLPAIADIFKNEVETSAEVFDSAHLANVLRGISSEQPISVMLPGTTAENDYTIWIPDGAAIQNRMQELFRPSDIEQGESSTDKEEAN